MPELKSTFPKLPDRNDLKYTEIENFEPYELLQCITYEAAIRVPDINNTLNEFHSLCSDAEKYKYKENELLNYLYLIHEELELAKVGFDLEAAMFFVLKKDDPNHEMKSKVLTSTPNKYEESKNGDIVQMTREEDGTISRKCLNTRRVEIEELIRLWEESKSRGSGPFGEKLDSQEFKDFEKMLEDKDLIINTFLNNEDMTIEELIEDDKLIEYFHEIVKFKSIKRSMNWAEFEYAPIFNLNLSMQRPIIKHRIKHKYLSIPFNFNLPKKDLEKQFKTILKIYDEYHQNSQNINKKYLDSMLEKLPGFFETASVFPSVYRDKNLLTAGDIGYTNSFFEPSTGKTCQEDKEYIDLFKEPDGIEPKKHNRSKIYADLFFTYDCMKLIQLNNKQLEKDLSDALEYIELVGNDNEDEEIKWAKEDFKQITDAEAYTHIYFLINSKHSTNSSTIESHWKYAQDLIDKRMYRSLM